MWETVARVWWYPFLLFVPSMSLLCESSFLRRKKAEADVLGVEGKFKTSALVFESVSKRKTLA